MPTPFQISVQNLATRVMCASKAAAAGSFVSTKSLPRWIVAALRSVKYNKRDIEVIPASKVSVVSSAGDGSRSYVMALNLATEKFDTSLGGWGGGMGTSPVDRGGSMAIPSNGAMIVGEYGGGGSYARLYVRPDNMATLIEQQDNIELSEDEKYALGFISAFNARGRKDAFQNKWYATYSPRHPFIVSLAQKGLVKVVGKGVRITIKGKNVAQQNGSQYEDDY